MAVSQFLIISLFLLVDGGISKNYTNSLYQEFSGTANQTNATLSLAELATIIQTIQNCSEPFYPVLVGAVPKADFESHCPQILYGLTQSCDRGHDSGDEKPRKPKSFEVWGYGFLFVTAINLCSLFGILILPLMKKSFYNDILIFLISLAVGSLCTNGVIVLIPEAFHIIEEPGYVWKAVTIMGGVYLFFVTERILKIITEHCVAKNSERYELETLKSHTGQDMTNGSIPVETYIDIDRTAMDSCETANKNRKTDTTLQEDCNLLIESNLQSSNADQLTPSISNGGAVVNDEPKADLVSQNKKPVSTIAWMIIFGDAFHNFIDGLTIGAAFSDSIVLGISICIAVLCEELPHELGDFAILLNAGLSKKKALLFNFLSACTCYIGLIIGITLSKVSYATPWILGLAGGMFLYISLADMMPEMNFAAEKYKNQKLKIFLLQNSGLLLGFGIILVVTLYGGLITL